MNFEWDEPKNEINIQKHELDFFDVWEMFEAPILLENDTRRDYGENRLIGIGILRNFVAVVVFTERKSDIIRVISLRRANRHERKKFFKYLQNQLGTPGSND
jgi:uncharacterized protein